MENMDLVAVRNSLSIRPRTVHDYVVTIDGQEFDVENLYETLSEVSGGNVVVHDDKYGKMFLKFGILESLGSHRWFMGAEEGPNFPHFYAVMYDIMHEAKPLERLVVTFDVGDGVECSGVDHVPVTYSSKEALMEALKTKFAEWKARGGFNSPSGGGGSEEQFENTPLYIDWFSSLQDGEFEEPKIRTLEEWFEQEGKVKS